LQTAVQLAAADAAIDGRGEPAVLLSPACASFDQFADFEARGEAFRRAVLSLGDQPSEVTA
jgi:UDP-N-acetylmuramoylalanine--D-glutamate ligase